MSPTEPNPREPEAIEKPSASLEAVSPIPKSSLIKLRALRDNEKTYETGILPSDHPFFPGLIGEIKPYYGLEMDASQSGTWKIAVPGVLKSRISTMDSQKGLTYTLVVANEHGGYVKADGDVEARVGSILQIFDRDMTEEALEGLKRPPKTRKPLLRFLGIHPKK